MESGTPPRDTAWAMPENVEIMPRAYEASTAGPARHAWTAEQGTWPWPNTRLDGVAAGKRPKRGSLLRQTRKRPAHSVWEQRGECDRTRSACTAQAGHPR